MARVSTLKKNLISSILLVFFILTVTMSNAYAVVSANQMFDPKQTNELYDGLVSGASSREDLQGLEYDDSILWGVDGWSRAWLVTSLFADLKDYDSQMYDQFSSTASKFYVALVPPMFDEKYSYYVLALDEKDALNFTYTPGSTACSYSVIPGISQQNIDNLSLLAVKVWEVTETDFNELNKIIEDTKANEKSNSSLIILGIVAAILVLGIVFYKKKTSNNIKTSSDSVPVIQTESTINKIDRTLEGDGNGE